MPEVSENIGKIEYQHGRFIEWITAFEKDNVIARLFPELRKEILEAVRFPRLADIKKNLSSREFAKEVLRAYLHFGKVLESRIKAKESDSEPSLHTLVSSQIRLLKILAK